MVYQSGEMVFYGCHGVCNIVDIEIRTVDKREVEYYILESIYQQGTRFFVPVHNKIVTGKLRKLLTKEEWSTLLADKLPDMNAWIPDENRRVARYRDIINRGDPYELITVIRLLQKHRDEQVAIGRKFHSCDATILKTVEALILSELTYVFGRDCSDMI